MATSAEAQLLATFKGQLIEFFNELIEKFPMEGDLIKIRVFLDVALEPIALMNIFVQHLLPLKETVKNRDSSFFLGNRDLFCRFQQDSVLRFKKLWMSSNLDEEDRATIWRWFDAFMFMADRFVDMSSR